MKVLSTTPILGLLFSLILFSCTDKEKFESEIANYKTASAESEKQIVELEKQIKEAKVQLEDCNSISEDGVLFKVQIGAYNNLDLSSYANHSNFGLEKDTDGTLKYTLGIFKSYPDAESFKNMMRDMGVKGAWIVSYKDGERVDISEVIGA